MIPDSRASRRGYLRAKDLLDKFFAFWLLLFLLPALLLLSLAILAVDGRPVFFMQQRTGAGGQSFRLVKFRTMSNPTGADRDDDIQKVTSLGATLRKLSVDELPNLFNILSGRMSFVGPRPLLPEYLPLYSTMHARRSEVKPGITGLAQVSGRNLLSWKERLDLDVLYVDNVSLRVDLSILLRTIPVVLSLKGVNQSDGAPMPNLESDYLP